MWFQIELTHEKTVRTVGSGRLPEWEPQTDNYPIELDTRKFAFVSYRPDRKRWLSD
jgi:hypothetical protein